MDNKKYSTVQEGNEKREEKKSNPLYMDIGKKELSANEEADLLEQISHEYRAAKDHMDAKIEKHYLNLKLYNNQKRGEDKVGEPLLFSLHQTILAALTDDRFNVTFGRSEQAQKTALVAMSDYEDMEKDLVDYFWNWNALFYGRACVLMTDFLRDELLPCPQIIDPLLMLRDPKASSLNGTKYGAGARYWGRVVEMTRYEMEKNGTYNMNNLPEISRQAFLDNELMQRAKEARDEAQNRNEPVDYQQAAGDNQTYENVEWFTHFQGKKIFVTTTYECKTILRYTELKDQRSWPAVDKAPWPIPGDWDGVSVCDLSEDKQRTKAILINLALTSLVKDVDGQRVYDATRIDNRADLENGKDIAVNGAVGGVVDLVPSQTPNLSLFDYVSNTLDMAAQKATATPELTQGVLSKDNRTLGELNLAAQKSDTRYNQMAKLFASSEKRFWSRWYDMYITYMNNNDEKHIETDDEYGQGTRVLKKSDFISEDRKGVKIMVRSAVLEEAASMRVLGTFTQIMQILMQAPGANVSLIIRKLARLSSIPEEEISLLLPKSIEELRAQAENEVLEKGELVPVSIDDDHALHIAEHAQGKATSANTAHRRAHLEAMTIQRAFDLSQGVESVQPQPAEQTMPGEQQITPEATQRQPSADAAIESNTMVNGQAMAQAATA